MKRNDGILREESEDAGSIVNDKAGLMVVLCTVTVWSLLRNFGYNMGIICNQNNHSAFFNTDTHPYGVRSTFSLVRELVTFVGLHVVMCCLTASFTTALPLITLIAQNIRPEHRILPCLSRAPVWVQLKDPNSHPF